MDKIRKNETGLICRLNECSQEVMPKLYSTAVDTGYHNAREEEGNQITRGKEILRKK